MGEESLSISRALDLLQEQAIQVLKIDHAAEPAVEAFSLLTLVNSLGEKLRQNTSIRSFEIANVTLNGLSLKAILAALEGRSNFEKLRVSFASLDRDASKSIGVLSAFVEGVKGSLQEFALEGNMLGSYLFPMVSAFQVVHNLRILNLSENRIGSDANTVKAIMGFIETSRTLETIDLSVNELDDGSAKLLSTALVGKEKHLRVILDDNKIGSEGIKHLLNCVGRFSASLRSISLDEYLQLSGVSLGESQLSFMCEVLSANLSVTSVDLTACTLQVRDVVKMLPRLLGSLKTISLSRNALHDDGALEVAECIARCTTRLHTVDLSWNGITHQGFLRLASALSRVASLTAWRARGLAGDIDLSQAALRVIDYVALADCLADPACPMRSLKPGEGSRIHGGLEAILAAVVRNTSLVHIDLSGLSFGADPRRLEELERALARTSAALVDLSDNDLSPRDMELIGQGLALNPNVTHVRLTHNSRGAEPKATAPWCLLNAPRLVSLELNHTLLTNVATFVAYAARCKVTSLDLSFCNLGAMGTAELALLLRSNAALKSLNVQGNNMGSAGVRTLRSALSNNSTLKSLNLASNALGTEGAKFLATISWSLTDLVLDANAIGPEGFAALATSLRDNRTLNMLSICFDDFSSPTPVALFHSLPDTLASCRLKRLLLAHTALSLPLVNALAAALRSFPHLEHVDMSANALPPSFELESLDAASFGHVVLGAALVGARTITHISLSRVHLAAASAVADALRRCDALRSLHLSDFDCPPQHTASLLDALRDKQHLFSIAVRKHQVSLPVAASLAAVSSSCPALTQLDLSACAFDQHALSELLAALAASSITSLNLTHARLEPDDCLVLRSFLTRPTALAHLDITSLVAGAALEHIMCGLRDNSGVRWVVLTFAADVNGEGLWEMLAGNCGIQDLTISTHSTQDASASMWAEVCRGVESNATLLRVHTSATPTEAEQRARHGLTTTSHILEVRRGARTRLRIRDDTLAAPKCAALASALLSVECICAVLELETCRLGDAAALLDAVSRCTSLEYVLLTHCGITDSDVAALLHHLPSLQSLASLTIIQPGLSSASLAAIISAARSAMHVDISFAGAVIDSWVARAIETASHHLVSLRLAANHVPPAALHAIESALTANHHLTSLALDDPSVALAHLLDVNIAMHRLRQNSLASVCLPSTSLPAPKAVALAALLPSASTLTAVDVAQNELAADAVQAIVSKLPCSIVDLNLSGNVATGVVPRSLPRATRLHLSHAHLQDPSCIHRWLLCAPCLTHLDLSLNPHLAPCIPAIVTAECALVSLSFNHVPVDTKQLADALRQNRTLTSLSMEGSVASNLWSPILDAVRESNHTLLHLHGAPTTPEGVLVNTLLASASSSAECVIEHLFVGAHKARPLRLALCSAAEALRTLRLVDVALTDHGAAEVATALAATPRVQVVDLRHNALSPDACSEVARALHESHISSGVLFSLDLTGNALPPSGVRAMLEPLARPPNSSCMQLVALTITHPEALSAVAAFLRCTTCLTQVRVEGAVEGPQWADISCALRQTNFSLLRVESPSAIPAPFAADIAGALAFNELLATAACNVAGTYVGPHKARALAKALASSTREVLDVASCGLEDIGLAWVASVALAPSSTLYSTLRHLVLADNALGRRGSQPPTPRHEHEQRQLPRSATLHQQSPRLPDPQLLESAVAHPAADGMKHLAKYLAGVGTQLRVLDLRGNVLSKEAVEYLACGMGLNASLTHLDVRHCALTPHQVACIADSIWGHPALTRLEVMSPNAGLAAAVAGDENWASVEGRMALAHALVANSILTHIDLTPPPVLQRSQDWSREDECTRMDMMLRLLLRANIQHNLVVKPYLLHVPATDYLAGPEHVWHAALHLYALATAAHTLSPPPSASTGPSLGTLSSLTTEAALRRCMQRKSVRIYLCSTFEDAAQDRDVLHRYVFPSVRRFCAARGVDLVVADMNWGVASQADTLEPQTLALALREIEECQPYFIALLGQTYGFCDHESPLLRALINGAARDFPFVLHYRERSITELEILHAVLLRKDTDRRRKLFYFRDRRCDLRINASPDDAAKLATLKSHIRSAGCFVRDNYAGPVDLASILVNDLIDCIGRDFPATRPSPLNILTDASEQLCALHVNSTYVPRPHDFAALNAHATSTKSPSVLRVEGPCGVGKSALIANWLQHFTRRNAQIYVLPHFVGACDALPDIISRMAAALTSFLPHHHPGPRPRLHHVSTPDAADTYIAAAKVLDDAMLAARELPASCVGIVMVLEGVDALSDADQNKVAKMVPPLHAPPWIRFIVSYGPDFHWDERIGNRRLPSSLLTVAPLAPIERLIVARQYVRHHGRCCAYDDTTLHRIADSAACASPLFLRTQLQHLLSISSYDLRHIHLNSTINVRTLGELVSRVLQLWQHAFGAGILDLLAAIVITNGVLPESQLVEAAQVAPRWWSCMRFSTSFLPLDSCVLVAASSIVIPYPTLATALDAAMCAATASEGEGTLRRRVGLLSSLLSLVSAVAKEPTASPHKRSRAAAVLANLDTTLRTTCALLQPMSPSPPPSRKAGSPRPPVLQRVPQQVAVRQPSDASERIVQLARPTSAPQPEPPPSCVPLLPATAITAVVRRLHEGGVAQSAEHRERLDRQYVQPLTPKLPKLPPRAISAVTRRLFHENVAAIDKRRRELFARLVLSPRPAKT